MASESVQNGTNPSSSTLENKETGNKITQKFNDFLETLGDTLMDFTALEVNTMIVSNITGAKFNAFDAYRLIYERSQQAGIIARTAETASESIPENLCPRYRKLHDQLLAAYRLCPDKGQVDSLPNPDNPKEFQDLAQQLKEVNFVRTLRKLSELRAALDGESPSSSTSVDLIYAQTVMQIDGDVINRYNKALFDPDNVTRREIILNIHNQGVEAGERQWRGLMQFMVDLLTKFVAKK
jgi:hypothetical protein